jgi:NAD(P)-dependent dehydrogenase (short-subunit alcohol dehydrogenase family)
MRGVRNTDPGRTALPPEVATALARHLQAMIPLNRIGRAEDLASAVLFLASDKVRRHERRPLVLR